MNGLYNLKRNRMETIEEAVERLYPTIMVAIFTQKNKVDKNKERRRLFIAGAKYQAERSYTKEDMLNFSWWLLQNVGQYPYDYTSHFEGKYLEVFKQDKLNS